MSEDTSTIYYVPWDGNTFVMPDGRIIRTKPRNQILRGFDRGIREFMTWGTVGYLDGKLIPPYQLYQQDVYDKIREQAKIDRWLQAVQDIVHRWWSSLGIEQYESARIERMNRWKR